VGSKRRIFSAPECVLAVQGRSGSSKVDDFDTNQTRKEEPSGIAAVGFHRLDTFPVTQSPTSNH